MAPSEMGLKLGRWVPLGYLLSILFSTSMAYIATRENCCILDERFGSYCPTTCGIADFFNKYRLTTDGELLEIERLLQQAVNSTGSIEYLIQHIKTIYPSDKQTLPQSIESLTQKSKKIIEEIIRYENTILAHENTIQQLTDMHIMNSNKITQLKQKIAQLESHCQEPCKDTAEILETTGRGAQNVSCMVEV